jgi:hypothetical protein
MAPFGYFIRHCFNVLSAKSISPSAVPGINMKQVEMLSSKGHNFWLINHYSVKLNKRNLCYGSVLLHVFFDNLNDWNIKHKGCLAINRSWTAHILTCRILPLDTGP